jgi:hypothetical protein
LFNRQLARFALDYKQRVDVETALRFLEFTEKAIDFIANNPFACPCYEHGASDNMFRDLEYRKWGLHKFPHHLLFRMDDDKTILLEAIYAQKMDVGVRLGNDLGN